MRRLFAVLLALLCTGCMTSLDVQPTEPWEGHYFSFDELNSKTEGQALKDKQSMWLLSNSTLKRLLKDAGAK